MRIARGQRVRRRGDGSLEAGSSAAAQMCLGAGEALSSPTEPRGVMTDPALNVSRYDVTRAAP